MIYAMSGDMLKNILGDKGTECYCCGNNEGELKQCKVCKLTFCENCMANDDLCEDCMCELINDGEFATYVEPDVEAKLIKKYKD